MKICLIDSDIVLVIQYKHNLFIHETQISFLTKFIHDLFFILEPKQAFSGQF